MTDKINNRFMLDTNIVSHFIKGTRKVCDKVLSVPIPELCISAISEGELLFGLAKKPDAKDLQNLVHEFLIRVDVLPWNSEVAECYGILRADLQKKGKILGNLDMLIVSHALALDLILISNDQAFLQVDGLKIEDWSL